MNPSGAPPAGSQEKPSGLAPAAAAEHVRCSPPFVLSAAKTQKYLSSLVKADRYTAAIALAKQDPAGNYRGS